MQVFQYIFFRAHTKRSPEKLEKSREKLKKFRGSAINSPESQNNSVGHFQKTPDRFYKRLVQLFFISVLNTTSKQKES